MREAGIAQVRGGAQCLGSEYLNPAWSSWSGEGEVEKSILAGSHPQGPVCCWKVREGVTGEAGYIYSLRRSQELPGKGRTMLEVSENAESEGLLGNAQ